MEAERREKGLPSTSKRASVPTYQPWFSLFLLDRLIYRQPGLNSHLSSQGHAKAPSRWVLR